MKILFYRYGSICEPDIIEAMKHLGHEIFCINLEITDEEAETYADYYLSHEKERQQIAANALGKILEAHTFEHRIQTMLSVIDGQ